MKIIRIFIILLISVAVLNIRPAAAYPKEMMLYDFERDPQGWSIPDWAFAKKDYVAEEIGISEFQASSGRYALEMKVNFAGDTGWRGAYVERLIDVTDWSPFTHLSVDIFLPKDAPRGLRARIILTVGEDWRWTETNKAVILTPGEWTVIRVNLAPDSFDWRRFITDSFRSDVRKLGVRIETNGNIVYKGPIYIDNVKLSN
jgi:hypothetical protein